jgi:hypothetical protein
MAYIIRLERNNQDCIYRATWDGDPGRTYDIEHAELYKTEKSAKSALTQIRVKHRRPFKDARILKTRD